ncbi:hypothetical protein SpiGrapes_1932 [Sphaerochaeta pleomorpha str. Grapes]|uniref:Uncharacterized protein n=1 Tax=Sphaerochaeta pleomorpha (strain ATCC BAA-1885 / DSM 22778 / Grapes) TaxID=158190 RepID=G8QYU8_SPHPG|nr:hypothetical protein [Sphaerochaeta pleomorpha]AEV29725.1 hypothetical protein SpiGrapes_1932 [Sphaerochaeta pleomorpha str. Grapes]
MENNTPMILHLFQEMPYILDSENAKTLFQAYGTMLERIDRSAIGSEACIALSSVLTVLFSGHQDPPDEVTKLAIEQGKTIPERKKDWAIEPGDYNFVQLPFTPTAEQIEEELQPLLERQACDGCSTIYIRMIKENLLEVIVQVIWAV